jgi:hypothetical protein
MAVTQSLNYRAALQNLAPVFFESAPLLKNAYTQVGDSEVPAQKGQTITLARPNMNQFAAAAITAAAYGSGEQGVASINETVTLNQHYGVNWVPTALEVAQMAWEGLIPNTARIAVNALAKQVEGALADEAIVSCLGQVAKSADSVYDLAAVVDKFMANKVSDGRRVLAVPSMLHFTSNANLLHSSIGGGGVNGYSFNNALLPVEYSHALVGKSYTIGGSDSLYQVEEIEPIGETSILTDSEGSGSIKAGDLISFAGHTGVYLVMTGITAATQTLKIYPGLKSALAANEVISLATENTTCATLGIATHELALAVAFRPEMPSAANTVFMESVTDPTTGLSLTYEITREYKQDRHILSVLYGVGTARPEGIVRFKLT